MSMGGIIATIGRSRTTFPTTKQCLCGRVLTTDFIVSLSIKETLDIFSRSDSLTKLNKKMLSTWRYILSPRASGWFVIKVVNIPKCLILVMISSQ